MTRIHPIQTSLLATAVAVMGPLAGAHAGSFLSDFDSGLPANTAVFGTAAIPGSGGVNGSGCLQLTDTGVSETGVFIITSDLDSGTPVVSFTASFKMTVGRAGGDGFSFNFANDLDLTGNWGTGSPTAEEGNGTGLTIEFDTFFNGAGDNSPSIDVKVGGAEVATAFAPQLITTTGNYVDVVIQLNPDRTLTVIYDGVYAFDKLNLSASLTPAVYPFVGGLFGIGARNGSIGANKFMDNLNIVTRTTAGAFARSFAPLGRWPQPSSTIDIALTNYNTAVNSGSIALQLDGATVTPTITSASGQTSIHYAPAHPFAPYTTHTVSLVFADNASPTPNTTAVQYGFSLPAASYVTLFSEGFESYAASGNPLDMNYASGPNASPNGGPGNPWFGPLPPNGRVVTTEGGVVPHGGSQMIRGSAPSDLDENWYNVRYRFNNGANYTGNLMMDWWFYDPLGSGGSTYRDFGALGYYNTAPSTPDYPGAGSLNTGATAIQRLALGSYNAGASTDFTKYQARSVGASDGNAASGSDWFNTATTRSVGWHHGRVIVGPSIGSDLASSVNYVVYYIDDMTNPTFWHIDGLSYGYNVVELNLNYGATAGYLDDVSFAVGRPPNIAVSMSGSNAVLTWPGLDFVLQSKTGITDTWTDVTGATSPYSYDTTPNPQQFFRLRNY